MRRITTIVVAVVVALASLIGTAYLVGPAAARLAADGTCEISFRVNGVAGEYQAVDPAAYPVECAVALATATPIPPTATPGPGGLCPGEDLMHWHAPTIDGCVSGHEHGAAPPGWVAASGWMPMFDHPGNTPNENALKHSSFKGFTLADDGVSVYIIMHLDTNPNGHSSRFHSIQVWARDATGAVSHWDYWMDFGQGLQTGPTVRGNGCESTAIRPIMSVNYTGCGNLQFESWYGRGNGGWTWDAGFNVKAQYYAGASPQNPSNPDLAAIGIWLPTGQLNDVRRVEAAWYASRGPSPRGTFYANQFGQLVSGPDDPSCGQQVAIGAKTYTILCLEQHIAPSMTTVSFPGNAVQQQFPMPGVELPN